eukprot:1756371-Pyramimonas_sp.AAC.1
MHSQEEFAAELEKWNEQWRQRGANREFRAQQQKLLDECKADKTNRKRTTGQAGEQTELRNVGSQRPRGR